MAERQKRTLWLMVAILLVATLLRFAGLAALGLEHDEVANWLIDRAILDEGQHGVYFTAAYGHEAGFHYIQAAFVALLGDHSLALRAPAAFLGVLVVAVSFRLGRDLFPKKHIALISAALIAVTFYPTFYSRLGLRAMLLPFLAALSAIHFLRGLRSGAAARQNLAWAGALAGLATYSYMAARALPLFYIGYIVYLAIFHRKIVRSRLIGLLLFIFVYASVAAPLAIFLKNLPAGEFRISEIDAPLQALKAGNIMPVLTNAARILGGLGWRGDPLWRQNVADAPVFNPLIALFAYLGIGLALWRRKAAHIFILLWSAAFVLPSVVTVAAPSTIRMIGILPVLGLFPALFFCDFIHNLQGLSTKQPQLSTVIPKKWWITPLTIGLAWGIGRNVFFTQRLWPSNPEVQFVWQNDLTAIGRYLDGSPQKTPAIVVGWSPATLDSPTMRLTLRRDDVRLLHVGGIKPPDNPIDSLLLPSGAARVLRPTQLPLDDALQAWLDAAGAAQSFGNFVLTNVAALESKRVLADLGGEMILVSAEPSPNCTDPTKPCVITTHWQIQRPPDGQRRFFLHQLDADGALVTQDDALDAPTAFWQTGDHLIQIFTLPPSDHTHASLHLGLYNPQTGTRQPCLSGSFCQGDAADAALLPPIP